jgi:hypothetical protein
MSDTPLAPDWWLASDGKWYPPTSRPAAPAGAASYQRPPGLSPVLSGWVQGLFWAAGAMSVLTMALGVRARTTFDDFEAGNASFVEWADAHDALDVGVGLLGFTMLVLAILMVIWSFKAHQTTDRLNPQHRSWGSGWSIGAWFIPFANFILPKLVLTETERIAMAPRSGGQVDPGWRQQPSSALGWVWWITFVIGGIAFSVGTWTDEPEVLLRTTTELHAGIQGWPRRASSTRSPLCAAPFTSAASARRSHHERSTSPRPPGDLPGPLTLLSGLGHLGVAGADEPDVNQTAFHSVQSSPSRWRSTALPAVALVVLVAVVAGAMIAGRANLDAAKSVRIDDRTALIQQFNQAGVASYQAESTASRIDQTPFSPTDIAANEVLLESVQTSGAGQSLAGVAIVDRDGAVVGARPTNLAIPRDVLDSVVAVIEHGGGITPVFELDGEPVWAVLQAIGGPDPWVWS